MRGVFGFRHALLLGAVATALLLSTACGDGQAIDNLLVPGQTDFTNTEPSNSGGRASPESGNFAGGASKDSSTGQNAAPPTAPGAPPSGRDGQVEEADIYKVDKNRLFYLNTYRGFLIYDLKNPKLPKLISRLPVYGYPIEMFVKKNTVYALIKDALYLTQVNGKLQFKRRNVSQLVSIDISNLAKPKILKTVDITGQLREGVSRKIDDTVYVVSYISRYYYSGWYYSYNKDKQKEQAWVYSFNVADPKNLKLMDKLKIFEGGGYSSKNSVGGYSSRNFSSVTISATSNALMVVENWRKYGYVRGSKYNCGSYNSLQQAVVSIVDISDPKGNIKLHTQFETYGALGDQFKQTYIYDKKSNTGTYYGIFARREWSSSNCKGSSVIQNTLESWDVSDGKNPKPLTALAFGKPNETVRGSVFDRDRKVAYAITARQIDPLYALSFKDRKNLKILSEVDGLSGDMNVFRFINDKKFLIAIGRDNSGHCTGFGSPTTGWSTKVAVSIIDVQDLSKIKLVQRKCVAVKNASWVSSAVNTNLDQAHKMIGMHSDNKANVITVPVYYRNKSTSGSWWWYGYETAVGMMTWDLGKYDPKKSHKDQNVLQNFGTVIHPKGQVRRTIVFTHNETKPQRMMLNLSNTHLSLVNIDDLNKPAVQSIEEVAAFEGQLFRFGNYMVQHVQMGAYEPYSWGGQGGNVSEFRVKKIGGKLDDAVPITNFMVAQVQRVMKFKDNLLVFRRIPKEQTNKSGYTYWTNEIEAVVYNLSNPTKPVKKGSVKLPYSYLPYYYYYCGWRGYWGGYWFNPYSYYYSYSMDAWTLTDTGLTFLANEYDPASKSYLRKLVFLDLTNTAKPTTKYQLLTTNKDWYFFGLVADGSDPKSFYLTYRVSQGPVKIGNYTLHQYKYYAQRWTRGLTWTFEQPINLPGRLIKAWKDKGQQLLLTYDFTYKMKYTKNSSYWAPSYRLNLLRRGALGGVLLAELLDYTNFKSLSLKDLVLDGDKLYVNARRYSYYYYYDAYPGSSTTEDYSDRLMIYDLSAHKLAQTYSASTGTYNVRLMGTHKGRLFAYLPGDGVLVVDAKDPKSPKGQQFMRTLGYATHIEFSGDTVYVAAGYFGTYQFDLLKTVWPNI